MDFKTISPRLSSAADANKKLKLLWFARGKDDSLVKSNQDFSELPTMDGIKHTLIVTEGNHRWPVWRRYLVDFLPKIF